MGCHARLNPRKAFPDSIVFRDAGSYNAVKMTERQSRRP
jgi:hypothetical protein